MIDVRIANIEIFRYAVPFTEPLIIGHHRLVSREGMVIRLLSPDGDSGIGEIAPLDGYSPETVDMAKKQCLELAGELKGLNVIEHIAGPLAQNRDPFPGTTVFPSVLFGVETAATLLLRNYLKRKIPGKKRELTFPDIRLNALADTSLHADKRGSCPARQGESGPIEFQVDSLIRQGFKTLKLKVGYDLLQEDIDRVNRVASVLPDGVKLRLDANRRWDLDIAVQFGNKIDEESISYIEYIEEPCQTVAEVTEFFIRTGIPAALDESLTVFRPESMAFPGGLGAIILKPTLLGGITRCDRWIEAARRHYITPVIGSCFEAGPGLAAIFSLILYSGLQETACGLDTLKSFGYSLFRTPPLIEEGMLSPRPALVGTCRDIYDFTLLEPVLSSRNHRGNLFYDQ